jgi:hypothetical protein
VAEANVDSLNLNLSPRLGAAPRMPQRSVGDAAIVHPDRRHDAITLFFVFGLKQTSGFALVQVIVAFAQVFDGRFRQIVFAHVDL